MQQVITFYERLNSDSKYYLDLAGGGDFYYMSPNEVYHIMDDLAKERDQGGRYQPPAAREENVNAIVTRSGKTTGPESETGTSAVKDNTAPQLDKELRRSSSSEDFSAPQSHEVRRSDTTEEEDDSGDEDLFNELYELIAKDNLEEYVGEIEQEELEDGLDSLETISPIEVNMDFDFDEDIEFLEALEEESVNGRECLEKVSPNEVNENSMVKEELEMKGELPVLNDPPLQDTNSNVIDKFVSCVLLLCRKKARGAYLKRKKCKARVEHVVIWTVLVILGCTRRWEDAILKIFEKLFVTNQFCVFDDYFCLDNFTDSLN